METDVREFGRRGSGLALGWQIAFGVCVGSLAASVVSWVAIEARVRWELQQVASVSRDQAQRLAEQQRRAGLAAGEQAAAREAERVRLSVEQQRFAESAKASVAAEADRRDQAWRRFYRPSVGCVGSVATLDCANEHIRFMREFEQRYQAGRL